MYKGYYISCQCPYGYKVNPNNKTQFDRIKEFREVADKYLNFTELTNEIVHSLIDHIEIDDNTIDNKKIKEINIIYRFIC